MPIINSKLQLTQQRQPITNPFGSTFEFFANAQTNAKNAKELPSQRTTTRQTETK